MDVWDVVLRWLPVVILLTQGVLGWAVWSLKQQFVSNKDCKASREKCGGSKDEADTKASDRLKELETSIPALPSRTEFKDLTDKMEGVRGEMGKLQGRLSGINRAVDLLNQHHLGAGG